MNSNNSQKKYIYILEWDWIWGRKKDLKDHVYVKVLVGVRRSDENPKNYKPTVC
jgi:hypothetical protein